MGPTNATKKVVLQDAQFKAQLHIGEEPYRLLRMRNVPPHIAWFLSTGALGSVTAASPVIAGKFFPAAGFLGWIGWGTAVTPVGWVISAGLLSATIGTAAKIGYDKWTHKKSADRTKRIPDWLNTPLNILAAGIFDLLAPLALRISNADGQNHENDARARNEVSNWFIKTWGYDPRFVRDRVRYCTDRLGNTGTEELAQRLVTFLRKTEEKNDCNARRVLENVTEFLQDMDQMNRRDARHDRNAFRKVEKILLQKLR